MSTTSATEALPRPTRLSDVKGWFFPADQLLFDWFLDRQRGRDQRGDLLELGAYLGKSAIFMGSYLQGGETFTVCDLFDSPAPDDPNSKEMNRSYSTLTRRAFEANYRSFHDELPTILQAPSSVVADEVAPDSCRFAHIDASHLYEHVHGDILAARELLGPDGIVVLDDFRAEHCPGVAAATWGAVATTGLKPLCITATKFYGTWGAYEEVHGELREMLRGRDDLWHGVEEVAGYPLIRIDGKKAKAPTQPRSRYEGESPSTPAEPTRSGFARLTRTLRGRG
ncbi:class I SAM-dependent methyltransferase [Streptomyces luteolus]|uniref:Class I SAM-dependent methyltransferase n=1 Tax=Streptomyces luteolus TaxID=3043615 RepID=A0ABT6T1H4_9ACTN|nr:class I SAM-dependent methyltransferase [Streptomyces sp. B-S-A12]MDI3421710.1 class I SAM-dependent methyltransferase [Streptomyces sp. B-S-A12]